TPDIVARADDGFATDLPSGDEVIVEPVVETSPAPVADDLAPASVEGFRNVVVVDGPLFNDAKVHRDLPDHNGIEVVAVD
ncbi:hypothetical protein QIG75_27690, partial [Klebsiella pneumoniae]|nr:hypothetical protein [Klebsiella pneumoniae]